MQSLQIQTRWTSSVSPTDVLPEYPRPQLVRSQWQNLNGLWSYAITEQSVVVPSSYDGSILVPFPIESALSGVQRPLLPSQLLWYRRSFEVAPAKKGERTLLHFGAVDWRTTVYVNGREIGNHDGGYQEFTFDITEALKDGPNELLVKVFDPTDHGANPHGKQVLTPAGMMYTATSGIWQTVWLESVPSTYIDGVVLTPDVDRSVLHLEVHLTGDRTAYSVEAITRAGTLVVSRQKVSGDTALPIPSAHLWSPDDPYLYGLQIRLLKDGKPVDEVKSYFGMRKIEIKTDSAGIERIFLNNVYTYNLGILDQGFWPDGLYTAPTDDALKFDIQAIKAMGFNTIRKHIKVESARWYYHCDQLGILVWQDLVNPGTGSIDPANVSSQGRVEFEKESQGILTQLHNYPSITTWVVFNEGWGAFDQARLTKWVKDADPSRLVNGHTGGYFGKMEGDSEGRWTNSDLTDVHSYPPPEAPPHLPGKGEVLGEFGGIGVFIQDHIWDDLAAGGWGYLKVSPPELEQSYGEMVDELKVLETNGLSGSIYTQVTDVEGEQNGLLTYDRAVVKIPLDRLRHINARLHPTTTNYAAATAGLVLESADLTPEGERYARALADYKAGNRAAPFLRRLTLMAIRQKDQATATLVGNELIDQIGDPFTTANVKLIREITRTYTDKGFDILRANMRRIDSVAGEDAAERTIRSIIERESIDPLLSTPNAKPDWGSLEQTLTKRFGYLGQEAVAGKAMTFFFGAKQWREFGHYYAIYLDTAASRSEYNINTISWAVFEHISDPAVLRVAIRAQKYSMDTFSQGDPRDMDTYANLLYKAGRVLEAIEWQERANVLNAGRGPEIADNLAKMKAGTPTWPAER